MYTIRSRSILSLVRADNTGSSVLFHMARYLKQLRSVYMNKHQKKVYDYLIQHAAKHTKASISVIEADAISFQVSNGFILSKRETEVVVVKFLLDSSR